MPPVWAVTCHQSEPHGRICGSECGVERPGQPSRKETQSTTSTQSANSSHIPASIPQRLTLSDRRSCGKERPPFPLFHPKIMTEYELCLALLQCDTEDGVIALLSEAGYWADRDAWRYFGDLENNWSTIGNQQSSPHAALVEKLVNAVDATLMGCCYAAGIEPTAVEAPRTMRAAVAQFFENTTLEQNPHAGLIRTWPASKRTQVAQSITLVATGPKSKPCFTIADAGEGQTPDEMPNTLLSLTRTNKLRIPFVQGKFNMGGTGVFKFCGRQNLQLVISRRHPKALKGYSRDSHLWGFTVIRREDPERGRRSSVFTYLAPLGKDVQPGNGGVLDLLPMSFRSFHFLDVRTAVIRMGGTRDGEQQSSSTNTPCPLAAGQTS